jgi:hypothetical protein
MAPVADDAIDELDTFAYLGRFVRIGVNGKVLKFVSAFDVTMRANFDILDDARGLYNTLGADIAVVTAPAVKAALRDLFESGLHRGIVAVLGPYISICRYHAVERQHLATAGLVHDIQPHPQGLRFAVFEYTIAEFRMVSSLHLVDACQDAAVIYYVMREISDIMDRDVVPDIAGNDLAVGDADRHAKIVVFKYDPPEASDTDKTEELAVLHLTGVELVRHEYAVPVIRSIVVLDELSYFVRLQVAPPVLGPGDLLVANVVFVFAFWKELWRDESPVNTLPGQHFDCIHFPAPETYKLWDLWRYDLKWAILDSNQ